MNIIKIKKSLTATILLVTLALFLLTGCIGDSSNNGDSGEDFTFVDLQGNEQHLSDYRGKVVVVDLMGINCPPCAVQMFEIEQIYSSYSSEDVAIISIDVWSSFGETAQDLNDLKSAFSCVSPCDKENKYLNLNLKELKEAYNKQNGIDLDWTFGLDDNEGSIFYEYVGVGGGVPTICIFDQKGNLHLKHSGLSVFSDIPYFLSSLSPPPQKLAPEINELLE